MKVLQIINSLHTGGAQKLLEQSILKYHEKGIEVDLYLLKDQETHLRKSLADLPNITIHSSLGNFSFYNPIHIMFLARIIPKYRIIHVHLFPVLFWVALANIFLGGRNSKRCLIYTEHSTNNKRRQSGILKIIDRFIYKQFQYIVAISEKAAHTLKAHLGPKFHNIVTIQNGVNLATYKNASPYSKSKLGFKDTDNLIIQVSSLRYPKDQETVIKALNELDIPNVHLLLAGEGPLKSELQKKALNLGISDRVHFLGNRNDIPMLLKAVDIVVLSSEYEGLSLASVEGMISGKPFIATDVPGLSEVVKDAGILFPYKNASALASEISKLLKEPNYREEIVMSCQQRALLFDIDVMINNYINLFERCENQITR